MTDVKKEVIWQNVQNIQNDLQPGKHVRSKVDNKVYLITDNYGKRAIGVSTVDISNPSEWEVLNDA